MLYKFIVVKLEVTLIDPIALILYNLLFDVLTNLLEVSLSII